MPRFSVTIKDEDLGFNDLLEELEDEKADHVAVGLLGQLESDIVMIGFWNEFGTKNIPERPFIRQTFDTRRAKLKKIAGILADKIYKGEMGKKEALEVLGDSFLIEIRKAINNMEFPVSGKDSKGREYTWNAPETVKKKGADFPLVDNGRMQQSLDFEVRKKGVENE